MWYTYFMGVITIATIIRIVFIMTGSMDLRTKISKGANWLIGAIVVTIAWNVFSYIFNGRVGEFRATGVNNSTYVEESEDEDDIDYGYDIEDGYTGESNDIVLPEAE